MLFFSLIIYLILWVPFYFLISVFLKFNHFILFSPSTLFFLSFLLAYFILYLLHSYAPSKKLIIQSMIRKKGVEWLILVGIITSLFSIFIFIVLKSFNFLYIGFIIPTLFISFVNFFNIEIFPENLKSEEIEEKIPLPDISNLLEEFGIKLEGDIILKTFQWEYGGTTYKLELEIRKELYEEYKKRKRVPAEDWAREYVVNGICGEIRELAYNLMKIGKPYNTWEEVSFIFSFVRTVISYSHDIELDEKEIIKGEYPKYPLETLVEEKGDCEDFSILAASILKSMGYDVALIFIPGHCALGITEVEGIKGEFVEYDGKKYFYCEMTEEGWKIGELPKGLSLKEAKVFPIPGIPVKFAFEFEKYNENDKMEVENDRN